MPVGFTDVFLRATGVPPFPFQAAFAQSSSLPDILEAPTGAGKTATAVLGWLWRRRYAHPDTRAATPRRLVFCLPMRSLVSQTISATRTWLSRLELTDIEVYELRGGAVQNDFDEHPDRDMIIVGTQDQLLSRALNRGFGVSRFRWPTHYALLNNDCLWVMDEIQLMGVGLSTSAQLATWRARWHTFGPQHSVWMSATLDDRLLRTVDFPKAPLERAGLSDADRARPHLAKRLNAAKTMTLAPDLFGQGDDTYLDALCARLVAEHRPGTRTLVVLNRVSRAQGVYERLRATDTPCGLLHSRFRPHDRAAVEREVLAPDWTGVLVATQAVEAGVDITSRLLVTELAPWSSIVQRLGRCNRTGEWPASDPATVLVIDLPAPDPSDSKAVSAHADHALPYTVESLQHARDLVRAHPDASPGALASGLLPDAEPLGPVVRRRDLESLFDTTPDLNGRDLDVSCWVRDAGVADLQVAFRAWEPGPPSADAPALHRDELCRISIGAARRHLEKKLKKRGHDLAYRWDSLRGRWEPATADLLPGQAYLLRCEAGGYTEALGWTGSPKDIPQPVSTAAIRQDEDQADRLTRGSRHYVTLKQHAEETRSACVELLRDLDRTLPADALIEAAHWHDLGKVHPAFQQMLLSPLDDDDPLLSGGPWAKSDGRKGGARCTRRHFRHELASALAMLYLGRDDLPAYLVACHHGKVRASIRSRPDEPPAPGGTRFALGVYEGDVLPATPLGAGLTVPEVPLSLRVMELGGVGQDRSWTDRTLGLLDAWGPFRLALMETLVRVADWRASALHGEATHA